jgi:type I restriction enzyme S subunit
MLQSEAHSDRDTLVPYLKAVSVQWEEAKVSDPEEMWADRREIGQFGIKDGDLLVCEGGEVGRAAIVRRPPSPCIIQNALHRVRVKREADVRFLLYVLRTAAGQGWFDVLCNRATIAHFTGEKFANLRAHFPDAMTQAAIAAFLDRETARLDGLVAQKEKLLALLEEKRASLVTHAVTHGLNPHAPTKPSGIPWLGHIPKHWEVCRVKIVAKLRTGHTPSRQHPEYWLNCHIPWFTLADIWQLRDGRKEYVEETAERISDVGLANSAAELLPPRTVILSRTASVGFSGITNCAMATSQDFVNWICGPRIRPEYLLYVFRGMGQEFGRLTMGSTHQTIYMPTVASLTTPLPPVEEQDAIVAQIRRCISRLDPLQEKIRVAIALFCERRTALISAAVTGQIDVRNWKPAAA